jgi:hypothetical protein
VSDLQVIPTSEGLRIQWARSPDFDYTTTELRLGSVWDAATRVADKAATTHLLGWPPAPGTINVLARHYRRGGPAGPVNSVPYVYAGPAELLALLQGRIGNAQLTAALAGEVAKVSAGAEVAGSVAARIAAEAQLRETGDGNLSTRIDTLTTRTGTAEGSISNLQTAFSNDQLAQAATVQRLIAQRAGEVLNSDPWVESLANWAPWRGATIPVPNVVLGTPPAGEATRHTLRAVAPDVSCVNMPEIPVDRTRRYRLSCRARRNPAQASGRLYSFLGLYREDYSVITGAVSYWWLYGAAAVDPGPTGTTFTVDFGAGVPGLELPADARWMTPGLALCWTDGGSVPVPPGSWMEAWDVRITDITTAAGLQAQVTSVSEALTTLEGSTAQSIQSVQARQAAAASSGTSLWPDPAILDPAQWQGAFGAPPDRMTVSDGVAGPHTWRALAQTRAVEGVTRCYLAPGRVLRVSAWFRRSGDCNGTGYLRLIKGDGAGTVSEVLFGGGAEGFAPAPGVWTEVAASWTVPAGTIWVAPRLFLNTGGTAGWMEAQDIRIVDVTEAQVAQASVDTLSQATVSALGVLNARWSVRLDAGGRWAGLESTVNGQTSEIVLSAEAIKFSAPGYAVQPLFAFYTQPTQVGSITVQPGLYTRGATIDVVTANQIYAQSLSAISANVGEVTAGVVRNAAGTTRLDLNASGSAPVLAVGAAAAEVQVFDPVTGGYVARQMRDVQVSADGLAYFRRGVIGPPALVANGAFTIAGGSALLNTASGASGVPVLLGTYVVGSYEQTYPAGDGASPLGEQVGFFGRSQAVSLTQVGGTEPTTDPRKYVTAWVELQALYDQKQISPNHVPLPVTTQRKTITVLARVFATWTTTTGAIHGTGTYRVDSFNWALYRV